MLRPRIIPCLLLQCGRLVKTVRFSEPKYVGDPLNAVRIFNEKEVDELIVLDIDATTQGQAPNYDLISNLAGECRMPLCYGGGVKTVEQVEKIIGLGVEKVAIGSAAINNPCFITEASRRVGSQSIVVVLDVKKTGILFNSYTLFTHNARRATKINPVDFARQIQEHGAGEIVINSVDCDGTLQGYDLELINLVRSAVSLPVTAIGGAGNYSDLQSLIQRFHNIGAAAGSLFVFKGRYRAVLIQYPNPDEKAAIALAPVHFLEIDN